MGCGCRLDGDILDLRVVVEERAHKSTVERSTEESRRCRMDAKVATALLNVAGKVADSLVVKNSASARRVDVGCADETNGIVLREIGQVVELGVIFGVISGPAKRRDGRVDGRARERKGAVSERGDGADGGGDRVVSEACSPGVEEDARTCCRLSSKRYESEQQTERNAHLGRVRLRW